MSEPARTASNGGSLQYRVGDLLIDTGPQRVTRDGNVIALPKLSYDLLIALVRAAPNLLSIDALMGEVWPKLVVSPETVSQRIKLLRDALGDDPRNPRYVEGLRGRGYRLIPSRGEQYRVDGSDEIAGSDDALHYQISPRRRFNLLRRRRHRDHHLAAWRIWASVIAVALIFGALGVRKIATNRTEQAKNKCRCGGGPAA